MKSFVQGLLAILGGVLLPAVASAHEVYVLPSSMVQQAIAMSQFSLWDTIVANSGQVVFWGCITALIILGVFFISTSRLFERLFDPLLEKLPPYAPAISRVAIGISFLTAAYHGALFGPELPINSVFGDMTQVVEVVLIVIGIMITLGAYTRIAALVAAVLFFIEVSVHGSYLVTYTNYLGELIVLLILGAHSLSVHNKYHDVARIPAWLLRIKTALVPYSFLILRVSFGISLIYASVYAKIIHNNLALDVAYMYPSLVQFFGFEPHFLVLGAAILEILIGIFFILGIEIRFISLFLLSFLSLSLWYFGESVWPHLILIGIPIAFIFYGYDKYSLEGRLFKRAGREPVL